MKKRKSMSPGAAGRSPLWMILVWAAIGLVIMAFLITGVVLLVVSVPGWFPKFPALVPTSMPPGQGNTPGSSPGLLAASVTAAALLGAGAVGGVGILRQRSTERTHQLEQTRYDLEQIRYDLEQARHDAELVSRLRDRYSKAAEQLSHDNAAVRLAGVYATAGLADDWLARGQADEAQVCIDLLCAYQRLPLYPGGTQDDRPDREVRQTITRVIVHHLQDPQGKASWCGMDFDFTGATFTGDPDFSGTTFIGDTVNFSDATFIGDTVSFSRSTFGGGLVKFSDVTFTGDLVDFSNATFCGGDVEFCRSTFTGETVSFSRSTFSSDLVDFSGATFTVDSVNFPYMTFNCDLVYFRGSRFIGLDLDFSHMTVTGDLVDFSDATFCSDSVNFSDATFSGRAVEFAKAEFSTFVDYPDAEFSTGCEVEFCGAKFTGVRVNFSRAKFTEVRLDFSEAEFTGNVDLLTVKFTLVRVNFSNVKGHVKGPWGDALPTEWTTQPADS
ncbi:pentapeptide repeat-containing protein (plasmid) [Citricoccus nitrophenolicus]